MGKLTISETINMIKKNKDYLKEKVELPKNYKKQIEKIKASRER